MSTETKHTPGPWEAISGRSKDPIAIEEMNGVIIARVKRLDGLGGVGPHNARLIAAAPETAEERDRLKELITELRMSLETMHGIVLHGMTDDYDLMTEEIGRARRVIAKAKRAEATK